MTDQVVITLLVAAVPGWLGFLVWLVREDDDDTLVDGVMMGALGYAIVLSFAAIVCWLIIHVRIA